MVKRELRLNTALFTDYASKLRTVWLPEGQAAVPGDNDELVYPDGTIISKTFYYPITDKNNRSRVKASDGSAVLYDNNDGLPMDQVRLMETRVLVKLKESWVALPYIWNEAQTEAFLDVAGDSTNLTLVKNDSEEQFTYIVPDANECAGCHADGKSRKLVKPIGPRIRHLNRDLVYADGKQNQLDYWTAHGLLTGVDSTTATQNALWPNGRAGETLEHRARSYLDINCAHCHNPKGAAKNSGLWLTWDTTTPVRLGFCKPPVAAGKGTGDRKVAIQPGDPDGSILLYRMQSNDPGEMMPELGRSTSHAEGVALVSEWIASLEGDC
ncbi:SO2930 family diheme c-type cytochrome [Kistimonas scapharcae]|uniref:SO2930 family diheme c-type cytochrome n=1 Tax=Kistimonas scapharcae TaxID=1036133 RepID=UPI0031EF0776